MTDRRDFTERPQIDTSVHRPTHIDIEAQTPRTLPIYDGVDGAHPPTSPTESVRQRRINRSNTAKTYRPERRGGQTWQPGQEPGLDPSATPAVDALRAPKLHEECEITVIDYSQDVMLHHHFDNKGLDPFLAQPRPDWALCRWINVNGISWDVVKALGTDKGLHRLAIEDLLSHNQRTKADWYSDHTYSKSIYSAETFAQLM